MIRINLLGTERKQAKKAPAIDLGQRLTVACSLILVASVVGIGWWYWTLQNESARVDNEIVMKTAEAARLQSLLTEYRNSKHSARSCSSACSSLSSCAADRAFPYSFWIT